MNRCEGRTKMNRRCKNKTLGRYCYAHDVVEGDVSRIPMYLFVFVFVFMFLELGDSLYIPTPDSPMCIYELNSTL